MTIETKQVLIDKMRFFATLPILEQRELKKKEIIETFRSLIKYSDLTEEDFDFALDGVVVFGAMLHMMLHYDKIFKV